MKVRLLIFVWFHFLVINLAAQDNRVSKDEDLQNIFKGTWDIRSADNTIEVNTDFNDDVVDAPIDGGLSLLLAAGVLYGTKRIRRSRSRQLK